MDEVHVCVTEVDRGWTEVDVVQKWTETVSAPPAP